MNHTAICQHCGYYVGFDTTDTGAVASCPTCHKNMMLLPIRKRNRIAAWAFAWFFGLFGLDHFYLGETGYGLTFLFLTLFLFWTVLVPVILLVACIVKGIVYLTADDPRFD